MVTDGRGNHIAITGTGRAKLCMVTIYLRNGKGDGKKFLREVGEEMLKQRVVIETRWITNAAISAISAILQFCNLHYSV